MMKKWIQLIFDFHLPEDWLPKRPLKTRFLQILIVNVRGEFQDKHFNSIIDMLTVVMSCHERHLCSPARLYVKRKKSRAMWSFSYQNTSGDEVLANLLNASRSGPVSTWWWSPQRCRYGRIDPWGPYCPLWIPRNLPRSLKAWVKCHYHLISMKNWMTVDVIKTVYAKRKWLCYTDCWIALHQRTATEIQAMRSSGLSHSSRRMEP